MGRGATEDQVVLPIDHILGQSKWTDGLSPSDSCIRDPWWSFVQLFKHNLEVTSVLEVKSGQPITPIIQKSRTVKWSVYHNLRIWSAGYQMNFFSSRGEWGVKGRGYRVFLS